MINSTSINTTTTTSTPPIDSLFIVNSLLEDLYNLMSGLFSVPLDEIPGDLVKAIHEEMTLAQTVLKDMDSCKNELLKESLVHIRDVAYEAEYLVNSYVVGNLPVWYLNLRLPTVIQKIKHIGKRLQDIDKIIKDDVNIDQAFDKKLSFRAVETRVDDNIVVGFEEEHIKILADLIGGSKSREIISIFGLPGLGKTTMAKGLYNDRVSCDYFDERAWCVVSQTYEKRNVLAGILMSLAANKMDKQEKERIAKIIIKKEEESIVEMEARLSTEIYQRLKRQRYLIVLDDVWASTPWDELYRYFPDDVNGSRVILTSRIKDTAPTGSIFHPLHLLSKVQCWDLLEKKVFFGELCPSNLSCIGKAIAAKCHGLPLAVVVVSGFLAQLEKEENVWRKVEKNLFDSYIFDDQSGCLKILELSYEYLPNHLKLCFLYLGAFPEDEEIRTRKLVWLWIAEGFIPKQEYDSQETIAERYLFELINRSLVMVVKRKSLGGVKACGLHDLLHGMCRKKAHDENFLKYIKEEYSLYERHQRLYVHSDSSQLRRFGLCFRSLSCSFKEPLTGLWHMPLLRVIDMMEARSKNLNEIYHLVYLRYFAIFHVPRPIIVNNLVNLEVLYIGSDSIKLSVILKMVKLRHLHSNHGTYIEKDCDTSQTTSLKSLGRVIIRNHEYGEILRRSPCLLRLNCSFGGTIFPDLHSLTELESLNMSYANLRCEITEMWFPSTIKKLTLSEFCLTSEVISIIGRLPNLQYLKLSKDIMKGEALMEDEWVTKDGEFQELRFLILEWVHLTRWSMCNEHFPKLECLKLNNCKQLEEIPIDLGNIPTLQTVEVNYSSYKASLSAVQMEREQIESYGNEGLMVTINNRD